MFESVTVDEALSKGRKIITYPVTAIIFVSCGIVTYFFIQSYFQLLYMVMGLVLGFALGWLYWSFAIIKWRIWAFDNVRNVHKLKQKAIKEGLIWPDDSFFERTEIRTSSEQKKWLSLQDKFNRPDVFLDDYSVPTQTEIRYSKRKGVLDLIWIVPFFGFGLYYLSGLSYLILILPLAYLYVDYRIFNNRKPQIIVNNEGMGTVTTPFFKWEEINDERTSTESSGRQTCCYLRYNFPNGNERLQIDNFDIRPKELEHLMDVYRGRSEKKANMRKLN